jgi:hypothetical protein
MMPPASIQSAASVSAVPRDWLGGNADAADGPTPAQAAPWRSYFGTGPGWRPGWGMPSWP